MRARYPEDVPGFFVSAALRGNASSTICPNELSNLILLKNWHLLPPLKGVPGTQSCFSKGVEWLTLEPSPFQAWTVGIEGAFSAAQQHVDSFEREHQLQVMPSSGAYLDRHAHNQMIAQLIGSLSGIGRALRGDAFYELDLTLEWSGLLGRRLINGNPERHDGLLALSTDTVRTQYRFDDYALTHHLEAVITECARPLLSAFS